MINPIERITQNRIIKLFTEELGYSYYGNWEKREHNSNVEQEILKKNLLQRGYSEILANKAVKEAYDLEVGLLINFGSKKMDYSM